MALSVLPFTGSWLTALRVLLLTALLRGCAARPVSPLLIDWGVPGYVPVNTANTSGELFYVFCPPRNADRSAPLLLWLQGGPGSSGVQWGLFYEHGPMAFDAASRTLTRRAAAWNNEFAVLYVDQPVGTGFSTVTGRAYAQDEHDIAEGLAQFLTEWYKLGLWAQHNELFVVGESYGGHYVPAFARHVVTTGAPFNLQGIAVGDGLTDPAVQVLTKPLQALGFSLIDLELLPRVEALARSAATKCSLTPPDYLGAKRDRAVMEELVVNASGVSPFDIREFADTDTAPIERWLNSDATKSMLNVPADRSFHNDPEVDAALEDDLMRSWAFAFPELLRRLPRGVLLFQGQFDWKDGVVSNEEWVQRLAWPHARAFAAANRSQFRVRGEPKGWGKSFGGLTELAVANAGHMVPMNQPEAALHMITEFVRGRALFPGAAQAAAAPLHSAE